MCRVISPRRARQLQLRTRPVQRQRVLGASREEGRPRRSTPLRSGRARVLHSQASAHVARHDVITGRSATRVKARNRAARGGKVAGSVDVRSARQRKLAHLALGKRGVGSKEPTRPRNARTRKEVVMACRKARSARRRRSTWLSRVGCPKGTTARRGPDDSPARGKEQGSTKVRARASVSGCRLRHRTPSASRARKQSGGLAKGGQPGRVARRARGATPSEEGCRTEGRRLGSWQAVPFTRGGGSGLGLTGTTQADLRRRKRVSRDDGASEVKS